MWKVRHLNDSGELVEDQHDGSLCEIDGKYGEGRVIVVQRVVPPRGPVDQSEGADSIAVDRG